MAFKIIAFGTTKLFYSYYEIKHNLSIPILKHTKVCHSFAGKNIN